MPIYDVTLELHDRSQAQPKVLWAGIVRVTTASKAHAYAKAQLEVRTNPPLPKIEHLYTQIIGAVEVVVTEELL